jgi:hypothetical protein
MKSYWGVDHGDSVSKAMPSMGGMKKLVTQAGNNMRNAPGSKPIASGFKNQKAHMKQMGLTPLSGAKALTLGAGQTAKGAYQGASPGMKRAVGYGAVTAGGVGAAGGGYALANRKKKRA